MLYVKTWLEKRSRQLNLGIGPLHRQVLREPGTKERGVLDTMAWECSICEVTVQSLRLYVLY
ncbi:unnamed protein product [Periconia digitata]|uniref:Uncharacterized protein n=1 Tax=Periconia digitata TaxID=1303443 RepID=A0A9W4UIT2_9PLEO|nr:unnamed protein product [Periconia digitata]